jgi:hypothetical protein
MASSHAAKECNLGYWQMTRERGVLLNRNIGETIARALSAYAPLKDRLCIACAGSDGRLEKGYVSKVSLVLYHDGIGPHELGSVDAAIRAGMEGNGGPLFDEQTSEEKHVSAGCMSYAFGNRGLVYPSRVLDSYYMAGRQDLIRAAKAAMLAEWAGPEGRRINEYLRSRCRRAHQTMVSGIQIWKGQEVRHVDMNDGHADFYNTTGSDGEEVQVRSFKPGALRYVQIMLERAAVLIGRRMLSDGRPDDAERVLAGMGTPTVEKLRFLSDESLIRLGREQAETVIDCYLAFLRLYHRSENAFHGGNTRVEFDAREARERVDALQRLLANGIVDNE